MILEKITCPGLPPIKAVTINVSAEEAVRSAQLDLVITGPGIPVSEEQPVQLFARKSLMLTGYVRDIDTGYDAEARDLGVSLVSRTIDYVECSADHPTGEFLNKDIVTIARELDAFGIGIESDMRFPSEPRHKVMTGESPWSSIERRLRGRGALIHDTEKGRIKIANKPGGRHAGGLVRGKNILPGARARFSSEGRYSEIKVRGQATDGVDKQQLRPEAVARDRDVMRHRPLILYHEGETTVDRMKQRAVWAAKRMAGKGVTASVPVTGWRDARGKIWQPNWLVPVYDDLLGINGDMIIKAIRFMQNDSQGTVAVLELADPRALGGENPRGKTGKAYAAPGAIEADYADE
ncbi:hypothetical protein [Rhizobium sp. RU36D]|uniref:phage baseplate assembly protein n=1 Tax=Rhizobium sp. RU36D TaxID=1907415 RepID=UPI0009D7E64D|nr:hypothetical protein [Rhizobium sp. RU36D]SMD18464.1 Mu-like prophage tail protein gpP [Rhizobium sp. RU36D]